MVNTVNLTKPSLRFGDAGPAVKELQTLLDGYSKFINATAHIRCRSGVPENRWIAQAQYGG